MPVKSDWVTVVFLLIFLLLGFVKYIYKDRLIELLGLFFNKRYFLSYGKEGKLIFNGFNAFLFLIQMLIMSLFTFLLIQFYFVEMVDDHGLFLFLKIVFGILSFFLIRYLIGFLLALLFETNKSHKEIVFSKISYLFAITIIILPLLLLAYYVKNYNLVLFQLVSLLFGALLIVRYMFVLKNNKRVALSRLFYFMLYLCALEIAPILLVFKIIM